MSEETGTMKTHTHGKLVSEDGPQGTLLRCLESEGASRIIATMHPASTLYSHRLGNARRLSACWNVMEALPTELIEKMKSVVALYYEVPEQACLRAERDELLAACKAAVTALGIRNEFMPIGCGEFGSQMLNAIARAEQEASPQPTTNEELAS